MNNDKTNIIQTHVTLDLSSCFHLPFGVVGILWLKLLLRCARRDVQEPLGVEEYERARKMKNKTCMSTAYHR